MIRFPVSVVKQAYVVRTNLANRRAKKAEVRGDAATDELKTLNERMGKLKPGQLDASLIASSVAVSKEVETALKTYDHRSAKADKLANRVKLLEKVRSHWLVGLVDFTIAAGGIGYSVYTVAKAMNHPSVQGFDAKLAVMLASSPEWFKVALKWIQEVLAVVVA